MALAVEVRASPLSLSARTYTHRARRRRAVRVPAQRAAARVQLWDSDSGSEYREREFEASSRKCASYPSRSTRAGLLLKLFAKHPSGALNEDIDRTLSEISDATPRALFTSLWLRANKADPRPAVEIARNIRDSAARCRALAAIALNCGPLAGEVLDLAWSSATNVQDASERTALQALTVAQRAQVDPQLAFTLAGSGPVEARAELMLATLSQERLRTPEIARAIQAAIAQLPLKSLRTRLALAAGGAGADRNAAELLQTARELSDATERTMALLVADARI